MPVIGYLSARSPEDTAHLVEAFRRGLGETGFFEGHNVTIEYRWALGHQDRLPALAADLVQKPVTVLVSTGGEAAALAARAATSTIPIAFIIGGDPVKLGLASSYRRPGGNATGISILTATLEPKRLELLRELMPHVSTIGALLDPNFPPYEGQLRDLREAARALDLQVEELRASTDAEIDRAFEILAGQRIAALTVVAGPFFDTRREKLVAFAAHHAVPTMYHFREFPVTNFCRSGVRAISRQNCSSPITLTHSIKPIIEGKNVREPRNRVHREMFKRPAPPGRQALAPRAPEAVRPPKPRVLSRCQSSRL
jgi:putative tryptophan/tyrosine transport system substrate-binding protein